MKAYWEFCIPLVNNGGLGYNFIRHTPNPNSNETGLTFTTSITLPNHTIAEYRAFMRPLQEKLNALGIAVPMPPVQRFANIYTRDQPPSLARAQAISSASSAEDGTTNPLKPRALGDVVGNTLIASRFFPRSSFSSATSRTAMNAAIRTFIEAGGYEFHGMNYAPTLAVAGNPRNAVNPAFRSTVMHAQGYDSRSWWDGTRPVESMAIQAEKHRRLQAYMQGWRDITPGSGSYINEGDAQEPDWKGAFFGANYERLRGVKERWDPEGVFWALNTVGSDKWEVRGGSGGGRRGLYTQDGRLCRVEG